MAAMQVDVVSAERRLYSGEADGVYARSLEGEIAVLAGHQPALLELAGAPLRVHATGGEVVTFAVHSGFLEFRENHLTVLADVAERVDEIDVERARARQREFEQHLAREENAEIRAKLLRDNLRVDIGGA